MSNLKTSRQCIPKLDTILHSKPHIAHYIMLYKKVRNVSQIHRDEKIITLLNHFVKIDQINFGGLLCELTI